MNKTPSFIAYTAATLVWVAVCVMSTPLAATQIRASTDRLGTAGVSQYNLRIGNLRLGMTGTMSAEWSDNINYSDEGANEVSSWSYVPQLTLDAYWPLNPHVQISSGIAVGYRYYSDEDAENDWFVSGSGGQLFAEIISGQFRFDDTRITFRDTFSREIDTLDVAVVGNTEDYAINRNTLELIYSKALNPRMTGSAQYAHVNAWTDSDTYEYQDNVRDSIDVLLLYRLLKSLQVGPYARWESIRFTENIRNDRTSYEVGLHSTGSYKVGSAVSWSASIGYEQIAVDSSNNPAADDEEGNLSTNFNIHVSPINWPGHRFRLSYDREHENLNPAVNYSDQFLIGYGLDFRVLSDLLFRADIDWMNIEESDGGESAQLIRLWIRTSYNLTPRTTVGGGYRLTHKDSDVDGREYIQNMVHVDLTHRF